MKNGVLKSVAFCLFLAVFTLGTLITPSREFSENENRVLTKFPSLTLKNVSTGEAQAQLNLYASDQLFLRDFFVSLKCTSEKILGKKDIGGVYLSENGYYIRKTTEESVDDKKFESNLRAVDEFFKKNKALGKEHLTFLLVPTASGVLDSYLPKGADVFEQKSRIQKAKEMVSEVTFPDLLRELSVSPENLYYKTDHHWTSRGAYHAYTALCKAQSRVAKEYVSEIGSDVFRGTLHSKAPYFGAPSDTVELFKLKNEEDLTLYIEGEKQNFSIYDREKLEEKDKYTVFFGGNYGEMRIESKSGKGNLLIIKDSYANSFIPFIAEDYESITVVDPRYMKRPLSQIMEESEITDIMVLYNLETFVEDDYISNINLD